MSADRRAALEALRGLAVDPYPARCRRTHLIAELRAARPLTSSSLEPQALCCLAGRVAAITAEALALEDPSGRRWFSRPEAARRRTLEPAEEGRPAGPSQPVPLEPDQAWPLIQPGDVVQLELEPNGAEGREPAVSDVCSPTDAWAIRSISMLAKALRDPAPGDARGAPVPGGGATPATLVRRAAVIRHLREFFTAQDFVEVETPILAVHPGLEPHLDPFVSAYRPTPGEPGHPVYLLTSPEYAMKRLMAAGMERVFQLSKVFRNGEAGPFHNPEFTMLEWYRAFASYEEIQADLEALVVHLAQRLGLGIALVWQGRRVDLTPPWPRLTVREAFERYVGIDLATASEGEALREAASQAGIALPEGESWEEGFFRILVERIEPRLGLERPVFLTEYPAPFAALSKVRGGDFPVAERFELYIAGVEVGNAYTELNDPDAQAARFEEERALRLALELPVFEADPAYLAALERGLPPAGGIAVGVDRLVMLLLDLPDVRRALAFPFQGPAGDR
jgi:lysyl-tRNA synthetase class 2